MGFCLIALVLDVRSWNEILTLFLMVFSFLRLKKLINNSTGAFLVSYENLGLGWCQYMTPVLRLFQPFKPLLQAKIPSSHVNENLGLRCNRSGLNASDDSLAQYWSTACLESLVELQGIEPWSREDKCVRSTCLVAFDCRETQGRQQP